MLSRRNFLVTSSLAAGSLALPGILRADSGPLRIGVITTLTGPGQLYGQYIKDGSELAAQLINAAGGVGGRQVELVVRDDRNSPDGALAAFRELTGAGITLVAQGPFTANLLATLPLLQETGVTMMAVGSSALAVTHEAFTPNVFRLGYSAPMCFGGYGTLMAEKAPEIRSWTLARSDVQALKDITDAFSQNLSAAAAKAGREVSFAEPVLMPYNAPDFRNQISQIAGAGTDGLFSCLQGADLVTYYKQAQSFALDQRFKVLCDSAGELSIARALGKNMLGSLWSWTAWYPQGVKDNPASDELHKAYVALRDDPHPNWYVGVAHDCIQTLVRAVATTGASSAAELIPAIEAQSFQGAVGTVAFRKEDHGFAGDLTYIRFGKDEAAEQGWSVFEVAQLPGAQFLEPPTPGKPLH